MNAIITREQIKATEQKYNEAAEYYFSLRGKNRPSVYALADERGLRRERLQATIDQLFHFRYVCR